MSGASLDPLLSRLADGQWHLIDEPLRAQDVLATVGLQLEIDSAGRSRLAEPLELLQSELIRGHLDAAMLSLVERIDVHTTIDSTNSELQRSRPPRPGRARVCLAEFQSSGRGRRGRRWVAPFGHALCLSVAWHFPSLPRHLSATSLAVGVGVAQALRAFGIGTVELKWPNDLVCEGHKLGGLLIDAQGDGADTCVIVGLGLNLHIAPAQQQCIGALNGVAATGIATFDAALARKRNELAGVLVREIVLVLEKFGEAGLAPWSAQWRELDVLSGKIVEVSGVEHAFTGRALGIDESGALLVEQGERVRRVLAGEVSVRPQ